MSDTSKNQAEQHSRCPNCDSVIDADAERCFMCGEVVEREPGPDGESALDELANSVDEASLLSPEPDLGEESEDSEVSASLETEQQSTVPGAVESVMVERQSRITLLLALIAVVIIGLIAVVVLRFPVSAEVSFIPTETPIPPTITFTPSWTPLPAGEVQAQATATNTPIPEPTETPRPPREHIVAAGENLSGLSLRYDVSRESIAEANGLAPDAGLFLSQQLFIPWPTATPPLVPVAVEVRGQTIIADPSDCTFYEISSGDTLLGVASRNRVDLDAMLAVNRITLQSILHPGDKICIPKIIRSGIMPPTPGPSPTPTDTPPPAGPHLLLPFPESLFDSSDETIVLQWAAVKDLEEREWYMVEMIDLNEVDSHPRRGFVRQNSFVVPDEWRPKVEELHQFIWRITIVQVTGERDDGQFTFTYGGSSSEDSTLYWLGAVPTPTPTPTNTPIVTRESEENS